jgi:hypothetical protein
MFETHNALPPKLSCHQYVSSNRGRQLSPHAPNPKSPLVHNLLAAIVITRYVPVGPQYT